MKKLGFIIFAGSMFLGMVSCSKIKSYQCACTYIHHTDLFDSIPKQDINETSEVKGRTFELASMDCQSLEDKYFHQNFSGTCRIK